MTGSGHKVALQDQGGAPVLDGIGEPVTATAGDDGSWSIPASEFPDGTTEGFNGQVTATDAAGNESDPTPVASVEDTPSDAPIVEDANADGLSGTAEPGSTVLLKNDDGEPVASTTAAPISGDYRFSPNDFPGGMTDGFIGEVTSSDVAGNESEPTPVVSIDGSAPERPRINSANVHGLTGEAEPGSTLILEDDQGKLIATVTADPLSGEYRFAAIEFPEGATDSFTGAVTATDAVGNISAPAPVADIDGNVPNRPLIGRADTEEVSGTAEPGSRVTLKDDEGTPVATDTADPMSGEYSFAATDFLEDNTHGFTGLVTATDAAGNESSPASVTAIDNKSATIERMTVAADSHGGCETTTVAPVVLDLGQDGELNYSDTEASLPGLEGRTDAWMGSEDGVLMWDKNGDGRLTDLEQIAFTEFGGGTDLEGLRFEFDDNDDGVFDGMDSGFMEFGIWQDADGDGVFDSDELLTLHDVGIIAINLESDGIASQPHEGVQEFGRSTAVMADGSDMLLADTAFACISRLSEEEAVSVI